MTALNFHLSAPLQSNGFRPNFISSKSAPQSEVSDIRVARAAHDLGNRLQEAMSSFGLIRHKIKEGDFAAVQALIEAGESAVMGANGLAARLLDDCRPAARKADPIEIRAVLRAILPTIRLSAGEGILVSSISSCDGEQIACDFDGLQNALINLVRNAKDAIDGEGEIQIDVALHQPTGLVTDQRFVCFQVRDDGCGMTPSQLARAGKAFFTTKAPGRGTGIGLVSVKQFALENGGHFELESAASEGTTARIYLPLSQNI